ncbi:MAG TPA: hypothetical protein PKG54_15010 [Phycisphaerae bacterium]|nr:hypothetical protein [Phycisphaerae bacterium]HOJ54549.1 hypothetical protein [Phycisphaerae bacterium]HOL27058.1 hypothetical protein [Phycisphaerae bacterium]HPP22144.1 hypothetical protein [Phycisphaerae bacterium]HQE44518.1 hypothetical protein [Phycisphaerae bacterium]
MPRPCPPTAWRKHGVVLEPTESWEGKYIQNFTCPAEPLGGDRWRFWYSVSGGRGSYTLAYAEGVLGEKLQKVPVRCSPGRPADEPFSLGNLPDGWKPVQVIHVRLRDGRHRIYFWAHGPEVARYLAADSDDGRRYRVVDPHRPVLYHPNDRAARGVPSPDGVMLHRQLASRPADEPAAPSHLISNDATNLYLLPDGTFEMYSVALVSVPKDSPAYVPEDNAPGLIRVIDRYVSDDGLRFEHRQRVVQPDAKDPADQQFYYLAVTHTPRGCVGMLGHYPCRAQTMDIEWCFSDDGLKWHRPMRSAWLPRGEQGQPDSYGIYACNRLVSHGGTWHLFYTGVNNAHNGKHSYGPPRSVIMHATTDSIWANG